MRPYSPHDLERMADFLYIGAAAALVYPTGGDVPAENLYRSAGFVPIKRQYDYACRV